MLTDASQAWYDHAIPKSRLRSSPSPSFLHCWQQSFGDAQKRAKDTKEKELAKWRISIQFFFSDLDQSLVLSFLGKKELKFF